MNAVSMLGFAAASLTTGAMLPQVLRILRTRDTRAISATMYAAMSAGTLLWAIYGALRRDWALLAANVITFLFALSILLLKLFKVGVQASAEAVVLHEVPEGEQRPGG